KSEMARPRARLYLPCRWVVRLQRALVGIEPVDHHLVEPQVGDESVAIGGIEIDGMGVRSFLALLVDARAVMLHEARCLTQMPISANGQGAGAAAAVIGDQDMFALAIDDDVAGTGAAGGLLVQQG